MNTFIGGFDMRKIIILTIFTLVLSCSVLVQADEYVDTLSNDAVSKAEEEIQPRYEYIQNPLLRINEDNVEAILTTYKYASLKINVKIYQETENGWSVIVNKNFTETGYRLSGRVNYNFQSGVNYKITADYYANGEHGFLERFYYN